MLRTRPVVLLPWLLCAVTLTLLVLAAVVKVADPGTGGTNEEAIGAAAEALGFVSFPVVGAVLAARMPANPYGWVWCALGVAYTLLVLAAALHDSGAVTGWWLLAGAHLAYLALCALLALVFLLFPTGRLPGPRWRWLSRSTVALGIGLAATTPFTPSLIAPDTRPPWALDGAAGRLLAALVDVGGFSVLVPVLIAVASVFTRFRGADRTERQQLEWFVLAAAVNAAYITVELVGVPSWIPPLVWQITGVIALNSIPVAVVIAVLRYRLYEIDRIVSRTVTYGALTAAIFAVYLIVVAVVPQLGLPAGSSDAVVAAATLAVAALVGRVRRRLQAVVDRRFDRERYDAGRAVDAFAARLREQVDLDEVVDGLRGMVGATVAPTRVAVWVRPADRR